MQLGGVWVMRVGCRPRPLLLLPQGVGCGLVPHGVGSRPQNSSCGGKPAAWATGAVYYSEQGKNKASHRELRAGGVCGMI